MPQYMGDIQCGGTLFVSYSTIGVLQCTSYTIQQEVFEGVDFCGWTILITPRTCARGKAIGFVHVFVCLSVCLSVQKSLDLEIQASQQDVSIIIVQRRQENLPSRRLKRSMSAINHVYRPRLSTTPSYAMCCLNRACLNSAQVRVFKFNN